jgi:DNA (cytosine-5)-methyltransferase 1
VEQNLNKNVPIVIDLFAGAGGMSYGFKQAGYRIIAALDCDYAAKITYESNFPTTKFYFNKIEEISVKTMMSDLALKEGELDCLVGGPPCQGFSAKGNMAIEDPRNILFRHFIRFVEVMAPKVVLIENVPPILTLGNNKFRDEICSLFEKISYRTFYKNLMAADYGVPQKRRRAFFIALKDHKIPLFPAPTHTAKRKSKNNILLPYVTVGEAIADLPSLKIGKRADNYAKRPFSDYQKLMHEGQDKLYNHEAKIQNEVNKERMRHLKQGQSMKDLPKCLQAKSGFSQAYGRLSKNRPACTITANMHNLGSGRYMHPTQNRGITVREAARLQSFDDRFIFYGSVYSQCGQVGNAVPPFLAKAIALEIKDNLL